jgi:hypothetical protein
MSLAQVIQVPFAPKLYGQASGVLLPDLINSQPASSLGMVADDDCQVQLFPRTIPSSALGVSTTTLQLSSGSTIVFSLKTVLGIGGSTLLAQATGFTEYQDGDSNWYYGALLHLRTSAITAALSSARSIQCVAEILITDATGAPKRYQFNVTLYQAVYTGSEEAPTAPTPGRVLAFTAGSQAIAASVDSVTVTGLGLGDTPALIVPWIVKSAGGEDNIRCILRSGWTADGFTVDLTGMTGDNTYRLCWIIIPTSGSVGQQAIASGQTSATVSLSLPSTPTAIIPFLVKASGGEANIDCYLRAGWTGASFTVDFDTTTPDGTYVLYYLIIP